MYDSMSSFLAHFYKLSYQCNVYLQISDLKFFKIVLEFYLGFARKRVKWHFLFANVSTMCHRNPHAVGSAVLAPGILSHMTDFCDPSFIRYTHFFRKCYILFWSSWGIQKPGSITFDKYWQPLVLSGWLQM